MVQSIFRSLIPDQLRSSQIKPGAKYQRLDRTITETAQVLAVETNDVGISHVLYIGRFEAKNGHGAEYVDQRKLALSTFQSAFTEVS